MYLSKATLLATFFLCCLTAVPRLNATNHSAFEDLSRILSKQITENKVSTVVVADITNAEGTACPEGLYFADLLSAYFAQPGRKLRVVSRDLLIHTLAAKKLTKWDVSSVEALHSVGTAIAAEAVAHGKFEKTEHELVLSVWVERISDGWTIGSASASVDRSPFFEGLTSYPQAQAVSEVRHSGKKEISIPECLDCPVPQFRNMADAETRVTLEVEVSSQGRVTSVRVIRGAGPEFNDEAFRALRVWRYKPARDKSGQSLAYTVQVEIFFY